LSINRQFKKIKVSRTIKYSILIFIGIAVLLSNFVACLSFTQCPSSSIHELLHPTSISPCMLFTIIGVIFWLFFAVILEVEKRENEKIEEDES